MSGIARSCAVVSEDRQCAAALSYSTMVAKTLLLAIPYPVRARDLLRNQAFQILKSSGHRIVLLSTLAGDPQFIREFSHPNVVIEPLRTVQPGRLESYL